ncbi:MAG: hypothetical protein SFV32_14795 [Opitutaceae bacterium]|nr:hypothetical protein [Opitutaceae bacterium]
MMLVLRHCWLVLRNDLRVGLRHMATGRITRYLGPAAMAILLLILSICAVLLFRSFQQAPPLAAETLAWALIAFLMFGSAANQTIALFHERSDLDLLLSAPVHPRSILLARLVAVSVAGGFTAALVFIPLWVGLSVSISLRYLAALPTWICLMFTAASLSIGCSLLLVKVLGTRHARTVMQVFGAVLGASVYILSQAGNFVPPETAQALLRTLAQALDLIGMREAALAGRGAWFPFLELLAITAIAVCGVLVLLDRTFLRSSLDAATTASARPRLHAPIKFREGVFAATVAKDLRLIGRDPLLLSQFLPALLYVVPPVLLLTRSPNVSTLAPLAIIFAIQGTAALASVAADGEECLDLILMSPTPEEKLRAAKAAAGMVIPCGLAAIACLAVALTGRPLSALLTLVVALSNAAAVGWLAVTKLRPTRRKDLVSWQYRKRGMGLGRGFLTVALILSGTLGVSWVQGGDPLLLAFGVGMILVNFVLAACCLTLARVRPYSADPVAGNA